MHCLYMWACVHVNHLLDPWVNRRIHSLPIVAFDGGGFCGRSIRDCSNLLRLNVVTCAPNYSDQLLVMFYIFQNNVDFSFLSFVVRLLAYYKPGTNTSPIIYLNCICQSTYTRCLYTHYTRNRY